jgi:hypothetical protein
MCGTECSFSVNSRTYHNNSSTGSRWSVDCRQLKNHPMTVRGYEAGCISMDRLPNMRVFDGHLKAIPGNIMAIYITLTGVERIRKTNYLYLEEVAVINAALNLAGMSVKTSPGASDTYNDTSIRIQYFETKVRGKYSKHLTNKRETVSPISMKNFVRYVDDALAFILKSNDPTKYMHWIYSGMKFDKGDGLDKDKFLAAIETMKRGVYFSASLAGVKETFKERKEFIYHFNVGPGTAYSDPAWNKFIEEASEEAYDFMKNKLFKDAIIGATDVYHFDIGLEVTPLFNSGKSFLMNMEYAKKRLKEICGDRRMNNVFGTNIPVRRQGGIGQEDIRTNLLDRTGQQMFDTGEFHSPDEIHGIPRYIDSLRSPDTEVADAGEVINEADMEPNGDISLEDMFYENRKLGINSYEKFLSNGRIGGVHSGSALLRMIEKLVDNMEFDGEAIPPTTERDILPCRTSMEVCGGQAYDPGIMADYLTKQRTNLDEFASIPNLMSRILASNPGTMDSNRSEVYDTYCDRMDSLEMYIEDCINRLKNSSQHSARFEIFFMTTLTKEYADFTFPKIDLKKFLKVVVHEELTEALIGEMEANIKPLKWMSNELTNIKNGNNNLVPTPEKLNASVKTRIVCCCEVLIAMIDLQGFQGRIMKLLSGEKDEEGNPYAFFTIPEKFKVALNERDSHIDGIDFGLDPTLLLLPEVSNRFDANPRHAVDLHRKAFLFCLNWVNYSMQIHGMPWICTEKRLVLSTVH